MSKSQVEPLLIEDDNRFVMFPIKDESIWKIYKKQVDSLLSVGNTETTKYNS